MSHHLSGFPVPFLFLKATVKKPVWIPQYVKKDGTPVAGHTAMVHVADDHSNAKVAAGLGSYTQKQAHAALSKVEGFTDKPIDDQAAAILHHATELQDKASGAAVLSTFKKKILSTQNPTNAEWKAFDQAPEDKKAAIHKEAEAASTLVHLVGSYGKWKAAQSSAATVPVLQMIAAAALPPENSNAGVVNAKLKALAAAVTNGDAAAILAMGFGSNTYAIKAVKLANAALAALGSPHTVVAGQKAGTHTGAGVNPVATPTVAVTPASTAIPKLVGAKVIEPVAAPAAAKEDPGPKEGDTKPGANGGTLTFHNGRWHAQHENAANWVFDPKDMGMSYAPTLTANGENGTTIVIAKTDEGDFQAMKLDAEGQPIDYENFPDLNGAMACAKKYGAPEIPHAVALKLDPKAEPSKPATQASVQVTQYHYTNTLPGHNKYWSVYCEGSAMVTTHGAIGSKGAQTVKHFGSPQEASQAKAKIVAQKLKKGYMEASASTKLVTPNAPPAPTPKAPPVVAATTATVVESKPQPTVKVSSTLQAGQISVMQADGWLQTGPQKGSNPGGKFKDKAGAEWYCKFPGDPDVVKNELLAAKFYEMLGAKVPTLRLVKKDGKLGIASKWVDGIKKGTAEELAKAPGAHSGFVFDAWLANWDVVGLTNDNLMLGPKGALRVDVGGSLLYRAQGGKKGDDFGNTVPELDTLLDPVKNGKSAAVFAGITERDLKKGAQQLAKMKTGQIRALVDLFGPGGDAEKKALAVKLIARRQAILDKFNVADPWNVPAPNLEALKVRTADLPAAIDFSNYKGSGKGLSSKDHLNKQNTIDDAALIAYAKKGNLLALKNYQYEAFNKETGTSLGKKSITDHPNKDIKEHWAYLVELLDSIAHPSVMGLEMPALGAGSIDEVSEAAGFIKFGDRVATIPAEKRLGFWMKVAHAGDDFMDLVPKKTQFISAAYKSGKSALWAKISGTTKAFIAQVQASGWINHVFSEGKATVEASGHGHKYSGGVGGIAAAAYKDAVEMPEGTRLTRWMQMPEAMKAQLLKEKPGLIFQNTDSMCTSMSETWGKSAHFGSSALLNIVYAKGAKALNTFSSGGYSSEQEITTLMGQRFLLIKATKGNPSDSGGITLDLLMLPPHQGFVTDIEKQAKMGKSFFVFLRGKFKGSMT